MSPYGQSALVWTCKDQYWLVWLIMVFKDVVGWFLMSVPVCGPVLVHFTLSRVKNREWVKNREFLAFYSTRFEMILITAFLGWPPPSPPLPLPLPHHSLSPSPSPTSPSTPTLPTYGCSANVSSTGEKNCTRCTMQEGTFLWSPPRAMPLAPTASVTSNLLV